MGYLFGVCVEKNAELDPSLRKFKGRLVFQGNQVYDRGHNYAIFQDPGSSPATLPAAKAVDVYGCLLGHCIEIADAEQAYIQADTQGDPTWICLPPESRPAWWKKEMSASSTSCLSSLKGTIRSPRCRDILGKEMRCAHKVSRIRSYRTRMAVLLL